MPIPQSWTVWAPQLLSLLVGVLLFTVVLLPLTRAEARDDAPHRFAGTIALTHAGITDADLPTGWRVQQTAERAPWPSEAEARAVWSVAFSAADGRRRGAERVIVFPSSRQAERWLAQARERATARGAQASPCHYHAGPVTSATVRTTADGTLIEQVLLRQRSLVLRLMFSYPAADRAGAPCTDASQAIVAHASRRTAAFLKQSQAARQVDAGTHAGVLSDAVDGGGGAGDQIVGKGSFLRSLSCEAETGSGQAHRRHDVVTAYPHGVTRGTHRGEFMGIPATGKAITVGWISLFRLTPEGRIAESRVAFDQLGMMQQLGGVPAPAATPAP